MGYKELDGAQSLQAIKPIAFSDFVEGIENDLLLA
jgi:hypothetical protein